MKYTFIIAFVIIIFFAAQYVVPGFQDELTLVSSEVTSKPWTLVTSMFLHDGTDHLIFNLIALLIFGLVLETVVSKEHFLAIYFVGGMIASIAAAYAYPASLGASGAIMAVIGALAAMRPRMTVWAYSVPMPMVAAAIFWLSADLIGLFAPSNIANAAHIAGLLFGVAFGIAVRNKYPAPKRSGRRRILSDYEIDEWEESYVRGSKK